MSAEEQDAEQLSPKVLFARGMDFFEQGDYLAARKDFKRVVEISAGNDLERRARDMLKKLSMDPVEIVTGVVVFLLLIALFVFFGLKNH